MSSMSSTVGLKVSFKIREILSSPVTALQRPRRAATETEARSAFCSSCWLALAAMVYDQRRSKVGLVIFVWRFFKDKVASDGVQTKHENVQSQWSCDRESSCQKIADPDVGVDVDPKNVSGVCDQASFHGCKKWRQTRRPCPWISIFLQFPHFHVEGLLGSCEMNVKKLQCWQVFTLLVVFTISGLRGGDMESPEGTTKKKTRKRSKNAKNVSSDFRCGVTFWANVSLCCWCDIRLKIWTRLWHTDCNIPGSEQLYVSWSFRSLVWLSRRKAWKP